MLVEKSQKFVFVVRFLGRMKCERMPSLALPTLLRLLRVLGLLVTENPHGRVSVCGECAASVVTVLSDLWAEEEKSRRLWDIMPFRSFPSSKRAMRGTAISRGGTSDKLTGTPPCRIRASC